MTRNCPTHAVIELSYQCNLRCVTCSIWKNNAAVNRPEIRNLAIGQWRRIFIGLARAGIRKVTFLGGEPLLSQKLLPLLRFARELGLETVLVTNGTLLREKIIADLLAIPLQTIVISIDGCGESHDLIRGVPGIFPLVKANLRSLVKNKKAAKQKKPRILIYSTLSRQNIGQAEPLLYFARENGVDGIRFQLISIPDERIIRETNEILGTEAIRGHSFQVDPRLKPAKKKITEFSRLIRNNASWSRTTGIRLFTEKILTGPNHEPCRFIESGVVINPGGDVIPCPMLPDFQLGNLLENPILSIWGKDRHQKFLALCHSGHPLPVCLECCVEKVSPEKISGLRTASPGKKYPRKTHV